MAMLPHGTLASTGVINPEVDACHGYTIIHQDVRGTSDSEGDLQPMLDEAADGVDTLDWIRFQFRSDRRIETLGPSYMGGVRMLLAAEDPTG